MTVHFIAPKTNLMEEIEYFRLIVKAIHRRGHVLAKDWLEPGYLRLTHKQPDEFIDWSTSCRANIEAIPSCDVVIAEVSTKKFRCRISGWLSCLPKEADAPLASRGHIEGGFSWRFRQLVRSKG